MADILPVIRTENTRAGSPFPQFLKTPCYMSIFSFPRRLCRRWKSTATGFTPACFRRPGKNLNQFQHGVLCTPVLRPDLYIGALGKGIRSGIQDIHVCDLRLHIRGRKRTPRGRFCSGYAMGGYPRHMDLSGLRCRQGRLRNGGNLIRPSRHISGAGQHRVKKPG